MADEATLDSRTIDSLAVIRSIIVDSIEEAGSGHPGAALSIAPILNALYGDFMRHDPNNPSHSLRDRFVLSCGHAVAALYGTLHVMGYDLSSSDLRTLRQGGKCPGHPELWVTPGVEMSTGPLGFGFSASIGIALGLKLKFSKAKGESPRVLVMVSDGDLQEGVSLETAELAVQFGLSNLTAIYDSNRITIDGTTLDAWSDSIEHRFRAVGWDVLKVVPSDNGDVPQKGFLDLVTKAASSAKPTLIIVPTVIGFGVPSLAGSPKVHGSLLGPELAAKTKELVGVPGDPWSCLKFVDFSIGDGGVKRLSSYSETLGAELTPATGFTDQLNELIEAVRTTVLSDEEALRSLNGKICSSLIAASEYVVTGSADLTETTGLQNPAAEQSRKPISFGVREKSMAATAVGLAREGFLPIFSTFLAFSDLQRIEIRMAAIMKLPAVFLWTHDTVTIGPDGPTHQPVEQLTSLRAIPDFTVIRPAAAGELRLIWEKILTQQLPVGLVISRLKGFVAQDAGETVGDASFGGYVVSDWEKSYEGPKVVVISSGSEVSLCLSAKKIIGDLGRGVRVVSMPSISWFWAQDQQYQERILPSEEVGRLIVEAGSMASWWRFHTSTTDFVTIETFGESNSQPELERKFGFTPELVAEKILRKL